MKKNTVQILLSSYSLSGVSQEKNLRSYQFYYDVFSEMSEGGVRSSVFQLVEKGYLKRLTLNGQSFFRITDAGISQLGLLLPGLRIKERKKGDIKGWLLILITPPRHDPHFIKLHQVIKKHLFKSVVRAVYFYPFSAIPESVFELLLSRYSSSLSLVEVKDFSLAIPDLENDLINSKNNISEASSSVSKQLSLLIGNSDIKKRPIYQSKASIIKTFHFICEFLDHEQVVFLEDRSARDLFYQMLDQWNQLIFEIYFHSNS